MKINRSKIYVLGDCFIKENLSSNVISFCELKELIGGRLLNDVNSYDIYFGQGLNIDNVLSFKKTIDALDLGDRFRVVIDEKFNKSSKLVTHKHKVENILISTPLRLNDRTYESFLFVDERCSDINDHVSGDHIQGMVLIEAARQMTIAVSEIYFIDENSRGKLYFVTNNLEVKYKNFVFPFDTKIIYRINEFRGYNNNKKFNVTVLFYQNNFITTEINYVFSFYSRKCFTMLNCYCENKINYCSSGE